MKRATLITVILSLVFLAQEPARAYRDYFTPEQKDQLAKIRTVLVEAIALTDKGSVDAGPFRDVGVTRLSELGYTVITDASKPHDVVFKIKCEQRKTWRAQRPPAATPISPILPRASGRALPANSTMRWAL